MSLEQIIIIYQNILILFSDAFWCKKADMNINSRHLKILTANKEVKIISPLLFTRDKATLVNMCTKVFCRNLNSEEFGKVNERSSPSKYYYNGLRL